jgi:NitT/TauT family transport system permease protein
MATRAQPAPEVATTATARLKAGNGPKQRWKASLAPALALVAVVGIWQAASELGVVDELTLPAPTAVLSAFIELFSTGMVWPHLYATVYATTIGFAFGAGTGFALAVFSSFWDTFRRTVSPFMVALQVMPRVALAPIFITWFGFGYTPKIVMAATICFFPVFINTLTGLLAVDQGEMEMFRSMRANKRQVFMRLSLPNALPTTFAGLKTAMTLALIGAVVGEFVGTERGLGLLIDRFTFRLAMDSSFAIVLLLTIVGLLLYLLMEFLDKRIVFWTHDDRLSRKSMTVRPNDQGVAQ